VRLCPALVVCALAAGCEPDPTTLRLQIDAAPGLTVQSLRLTIGLGGDGGMSEQLPPAGGAPTLPGTVVVRLPDTEMDLDVALDALITNIGALHLSTIVHIVPHTEAAATMTLGGAPPQDMGTSDLAGSDMSGGCMLGARCAYAYRRQLTITAAAGAPLGVGYSVRVPLDTTNFPSGKVQADLDDVRVFGDLPDGEHHRIVDVAPPGQTRALWFKLIRPIAAGANDTGYSVYYGNVTAANPPADGAQVFVLYDGFDSGTAPNTSIWASNGTPSVGGGLLTVHKNTQEAVRTDVGGDNVPTLSVLEWRSSVTDPASAPQTVTEGTFWWWVGYQHNDNTFVASAPWVVWIQRAANSVRAERYEPNGTNCTTDPMCDGTALTLDNAFHWYRIERTAATTYYYLDGAPSYMINDPNNTDYSIMIRNYAVTSDLQVDWIRARIRAETEPTVTLGAEQPVP
jgi:hypothetical protein